MLFTFILVHLLEDWLIALVVATLDTLAAVIVWAHMKQRPLWGSGLVTVFALLVILLVSPAGRILDFASQALHFPGQTLLASEDTAYGRVAVVKAENQTTFYQSGTLVGMTEMERAAEETAFLALLAHSLPRHALILGGGASGVVRKALELPWLRVDYVELDGALIRMIRRHGAEADQRALRSDRVRVFEDTDARAFIKHATGRYDVILSALPNPSTGLLNRFHTREFFQEVSERLESEGVFGLQLSGAPTYMSTHHRALAATVFHTLQSVFPTVRALPSDNAIFFIASQEPSGLCLTADLWERRMKQWKLDPAWLTPGTLREITRPEPCIALANELNHAPVRHLNSDLHPVSYYHAPVSYTHLRAHET